MAKSENQKRKILAVREFLEQNTDPEHPASIRQIMDYLEARDIHAERKSIYRDIETLLDAGCDILTT